MKKKHERSILLILLLLISSGLIFIISYSLQKNISFFYYPTELLSTTTTDTKTIRLGGVVTPGSIIKYKSHINFSVHDDMNTIPVIYKKKILPNLFQGNSSVVAEGRFINGIFIAKNILAKHNEKYRPETP